MVRCKMGSGGGSDSKRVEHGGEWADAFFRFPVYRVDTGKRESTVVGAGPPRADYDTWIYIFLYII